MGRKAKCKYCGKSIDTDNAFKVIVGKTNRYYCNENEYNIIPVRVTSKMSPKAAS